MKNLPLSSLLLLFLLLATVAVLGLGPRPHAANTALQQARRAWLEEDPSGAAHSLATAAEGMSRRVDLWQMAGSYAMAAQDYWAAIGYYERGAPYGLSPHGLLEWGDAYHAVGNDAAALQTWQAALEAGAEAGEVYARRWPILLSLGSLEQARQELQTLAGLRPFDAELRYQLGLLLAVQQPALALPHLERAAALEEQYTPALEQVRRSVIAARSSDDPAYALLLVGRTLADLNEWSLAEAAFLQATRARPDYAEAWAYLGEARQHRTDPGTPFDPQAGRAELEKALELDSRSLSAHLLMSLYWSRKGELELAETLLQQAVQIDPENPALYAELGRLQAQGGNLDSAAQNYRRSVELAPQQPEFLRQVAEFSLQYRYQVRTLALPAARSAVNLNEQDALSLDVMGQVLMELDDFTNARRFFERALAQEPQLAAAHLHLALLYLQEGQPEPAYRYLLQASKLAEGQPIGQRAEALLQTYYP